VLVIAQIAATLLLLVGATVLGRSFLAVRSVSPGFNPEGVLSVQVAIPESKYPRDAQIVAFYTSVLDRVQALPGVIAVGVINRLPLSGDNQNAGLQIEDAAPHTRWPNVLTRTVSPGYFRALQIPMREGRSFSRIDGSDAPRVAIIDERLARAVWAGASPIGHRVREGGDEWSTVVGVVGHIQHEGLDDDSDPQVYWNYPQRVQDRLALVVRTRGNPASLSRAVAAAVRVHFDRRSTRRTLDAVVDRSPGERWLQTIPLATLGRGSAPVAIGAYGVIAYGVGQRTRSSAFAWRVPVGIT
jgi:hypothetical protein